MASFCREKKILKHKDRHTFPSHKQGDHDMNVCPGRGSNLQPLDYEAGSQSL